MTPAGDDKQPVEVIDEVVGGSRLVRQLFSFSVPDPPLHGVLVQATKNLLERRREVQIVKPERLSRLHQPVRPAVGGEWAQFNILPALTVAFDAHPLGDLGGIDSDAFGI